MPSRVRPVCVMKLGGSLFDLPDLAERIDSLVEMFFPEQQICLIPGGGRFVDELRRLDSIHQWPATRSHHLAVQLMGVTARMIAAVTGFLHVSDLAVASGVDRCVLDVSQLEELNELPSGWEVTSDSISAWVASRLHASELVLLKSTSLGESLPTLEEVQQADLVDSSFSGYARPLPLVRWVNMRSSVPAPSPWLCHGETIRHR